MMRMVLLAVCSANAVAFLQRHANQADDATGAEGHADERPPSNDAPASRSLMFATVPQKMTYSSNAGSGDAIFVNVNPNNVKKARCTNGEIGGTKADLAACKVRCEADASCKFIVHWSDNGCQLFASCTQATHNWGADSTVYQIHQYEAQPVCDNTCKWADDGACDDNGWDDTNRHLYTSPDLRFLGAFRPKNPRCHGDKCWCVSAGGKTCDPARTKLKDGQCDADECRDAKKCPGGGYWCADGTYYDPSLTTKCDMGTDCNDCNHVVLPTCADPFWVDTPHPNHEGWTRMEGGGHGGYTYHYGAAQPCTSGHMWDNDVSRAPAPQPTSRPCFARPRLSAW